MVNVSSSGIQPSDELFCLIVQLNYKRSGTTLWAAFPFFAACPSDHTPIKVLSSLKRRALQLDGALPPARLNRTALTIRRRISAGSASSSSMMPNGGLDALRMASLASSPLPMTRIGSPRSPDETVVRIRWPRIRQLQGQQDSIMHAAASFLESGLQVVVGINPENIMPYQRLLDQQHPLRAHNNQDPYRIIGADDVVPD